MDIFVFLPSPPLHDLEKMPSIQPKKKKKKKVKRGEKLGTHGAHLALIRVLLSKFTNLILKKGNYPLLLLYLLNTSYSPRTPHNPLLNPEIARIRLKRTHHPPQSLPKLYAHEINIFAAPLFALCAFYIGPMRLDPFYETLQGIKHKDISLHDAPNIVGNLAVGILFQTSHSKHAQRFNRVDNDEDIAVSTRGAESDGVNAISEALSERVAEVGADEREKIDIRFFFQACGTEVLLRTGSLGE